MKPKILLITTLLTIPIVSADCGLTNLAACLPEAFFQYIFMTFNAPVAPLLNLIKGLLTEPVNVSIFYGLWAIIIYVISLFYGLFFIFAGFNFMISGYDASKRENAKMWIRNIVLMVIFVQASFFIYEIIIELGSLMTAGVIDLIDPNFFYLVADDFGSFGLQLVLLFPYLLTLLTTVIFLGLRYLLISVGVVLFPFAIFFYFIPPLQSYGKMILNVLLVAVFITFFDAIILFGASALMELPIFENFNIVLATVGFLTINLVMLFVMVFAVVKAAFSVMNSDVGRNVTKAVKYFV